MYKRTIFNTPILAPVLRLLSLALCWLTGWKIERRHMDTRRMVMIAAPHTSNWDFILMLMAVFILRLDLYWMGKNSLFPRPFGSFMKYLGGIPIDRSRANNVVDQMVELFHTGRPLVLLNTPEGTRGKVGDWKTGWYHIAAGAKVPVQPAYVHAPDKIVGFFEAQSAEGDATTRIAEIRALYDGCKGIRPELS